MSRYISKHEKKRPTHLRQAPEYAPPDDAVREDEEQTAGRTAPTREELRAGIAAERDRESAAPFLAVLFILTVIAFIIPLRPANSMRERRTLTEFPAFSMKTLLNGDYFDGITLWFSDTFPGREGMLEISSRMDAMHGIRRNEVALTQTTAVHDEDQLDALLAEAEAAAQASPVPSAKPDGDEPGGQENRGKAPDENEGASGSGDGQPSGEEAEASSEPVDPDAVVEKWEGLNGEEEMKIYGDLVAIDGTAVSRIGFDKVASEHHAELMNRAGDALAAKGIRFFNLPAPTAISVLLSSEKLEELGSADQGKTLRYMFALENGNVGKVNAFNNLLAHNDEYLYYHTDHHWTALGAYYAYEEFCRTAGFEPVPLSEYEEKNMGQFIGSNANNVTVKLLPDEMIAYVPPGNVRMEVPGYPDATTPIVDETNSSPHMKYNCFINGDNIWTILTNDDLPDAPDCLVIKDSFGNPFTVYLTQHYHRVIILDYRQNFLPVSRVAEEYGVSDVILVQSIGVSQTKIAQNLLDNLMK